MALSRRDFLAGMTAATAQTALLGGSAFGGRGGNGGGNGGGGGGGDPVPSGTIYYIYEGLIYGMNADGTGKQVALPSEVGFNVSPSNLIYGPNTYLDRWWLTVARNPDRVYDWIIAGDGTVRQNVTYWDLVAIRPTPDLQAVETVQVTDLFMNIQLSTERYPEWGTDGTDTWITFRGEDVTDSVDVDPETGEVTLFQPYKPARNYVIQFSGVGIEAIAMGIEGAPEPVSNINDPRLTTLPTEGNDTTMFSMAPSQTAFAYMPAGSEQVVVNDLWLGIEYPVYQHGWLNTLAWSPAGDLILHRGSPDGVVTSDPDPSAGVNGDLILESNKTSYSSKTFSPDGEHIAYEGTTRKGFNVDRQVGIASKDGSGKTGITGDLNKSSQKEIKGWCSDVSTGA